MTQKAHGIGLLAAGQTLVWAGIYYVFPAMLIHWEDSLNWERTELTAAFTIAVLLSALCSPIAGRIIDHGRGASMMCASAATGGILLIAVSTATDIFQFYIYWAALGICFSGCLYEPCFALITRARGIDAKSSILKVSLIAGFASTLSFPGVHYLSSTVGWSNTLICFGLVVSLVAAPMLYIGANRAETSASSINRIASESTRSYTFLKNPIFWLSGVAFAWIALVHGMTLHHLLPLLREKGVAATTAVAIASLIGPMQVIGRILMVSTDQVVSNHRLMLGCFLALAVSIVILAASGTQIGLLVLFVIFFGSAYGMVSVLRP
nr:MFS transporter [Gammaproteobacteria bacterium]